MPPPSPFFSRDPKNKKSAPDVRFSHTFFDSAHAARAAFHLLTAPAAPIFPEFRCFNNVIHSVIPENTPFPRSPRRFRLLIVKKARFLSSYPPLTICQSPRRRRSRAFLILGVKLFPPIPREFRCFNNVIHSVNLKNTPFPRLARRFLPSIVKKSRFLNSYPSLTSR